MASFTELNDRKHNITLGPCWALSQYRSYVVGPETPMSPCSKSTMCLLIQVPCLHRGCRARLHLSSALPLPFFPICPSLFPSLFISSGPSLPLPVAPLPPCIPLCTSLHAAPPCLSPLFFISVVCPRLPFPSIIWRLIPPFRMISAHVFFVEVVLVCGCWGFFPRPPFFIVGGLSLVSFIRFLPMSSFFFFLCVAFPSTVFHLSISKGAVVGALGTGVFWVSCPAGEGMAVMEVEVIASWRGGYLIISASTTSWVAEVAWCEGIRLCSGDASLGRWVTGHLFIGILGLFFWLLVHRFLLLAGLRTASRIS
jgi:hypothetical protein